jgi:soluble lytic murein transglycosylase
MMKRIFGAGTFIFILFFPVILFALTNLSARQAFLAALSDLQKGKQKEFLVITTHLKNYPLYPYLLYADLAVHLPNASFGELQGFLDAYRDMPLSAHLRSLWLYQLASQNNWKTYLQIYTPSKDINLDCFQREAYWQTGQYANAVNALSDLLSKTNNVPSACLWVFGRALSAGNIGQHLLLDRMQIAFHNNNPGLAEKLAAFLPPAQKNLFTVWQAVYQNPLLLLNPRVFSVSPENNSAILLTGIQKLANKNSRLAAETWIRVQKQTPFDLQTQSKATSIIALNLAEDHDPIAENWLISVPEDSVDKDIREWRIRAALWNQHWQGVQAAIDLLPPIEKQSTEWRYWKARALFAEGQTESSKAIYRDLSVHGDFYGQLASLQLNQSPLVSISELKINPGQVSAIQNLPAMQRAYELYQLRWLPEATQEWEWAIKHMPEADYLAAAELAISWGWFERAIATVNLINDGGNIRLKFPLAYKDAVVTNAQKNGLNPAWVFALIRQESFFTPYAHSSAGAIGLMQLLPESASLIANHLHMGFSPINLTDAGTNLYLGNIYLRKMLDAFKGNEILATAAYNAGPNRVKKWIPAQAVPADIWIETIPYHETRTYVRNIMTSTTFYEKELGLNYSLPLTIHPL